RAPPLSSRTKQAGDSPRGRRGSSPCRRRPGAGSSCLGALRMAAGRTLRALVELFGLAARDAERLPVGGFEVLGEEDDLAGVLAGVRELAVDGLDDRVRLAADG